MAAKLVRGVNCGLRMNISLLGGAVINEDQMRQVVKAAKQSPRLCFCIFRNHEPDVEDAPEDLGHLTAAASPGGDQFRA